MKKSIKKGIAIATVLVTMSVAPLTAQVFLQKQKGDISPRSTKNGQNNEWIIIPTQGLDIDQYAATPVGSGVVVLTLLGGGYALLKKRRK